MKPISITSTCRSREGDNQVTISNMTSEEAELLVGMIRGKHWLSIDNGRLSTVARFNPLPGPVDDIDMMPFWRRFMLPLDGRLQVNTFDPESMKNISEGSIVIQSLCGYNYSEENYKRQAGKLISWGFECLRSRRKPDGGYWEIWYLPGPWAAKGELEDAIKKAEVEAKARGELRDSKRSTRATLTFLRKNVEFGTLDITAQRLCMVIDD